MLKNTVIRKRFVNRQRRLVAADVGHREVTQLDLS